MIDRLTETKDANECPMSLPGDIWQLIEETRATVAAVVNAIMTLLYWRFGERTCAEILVGGRAGHGAEIVATASGHVKTVFGRGFAEKDVRCMMQFADAFPFEQIAVRLSRRLGWSHFIAVLPLKDDLQGQRHESFQRPRAPLGNRAAQKKAEKPVPPLEETQ